MCTVDSVALGMCFAYSVLVVLYDSVQSISRKDHRSRKGGGGDPAGGKSTTTLRAEKGRWNTG